MSGQVLSRLIASAVAVGQRRVRKHTDAATNRITIDSAYASALQDMADVVNKQLEQRSIRRRVQAHEIAQWMIAEQLGHSNRHEACVAGLESELSRTRARRTPCK